LPHLDGSQDQAYEIYESSAPFVESVELRVNAACGSTARIGIWRLFMRMIMLVQFPIEPFNTLVRNGTVGEKMHQILDATKPESAYFTEQEGHRGGIFVVNIDSSSDIPRLAEPWFLLFNAEVEFRIAMTPEDFGSADLGALGKKWA
jgi:hypothetical protein